MRRLQPRAVLGLGGFAAAPATWWAARAGFRTAMLNPDAVPGKANRGLSRHVEAIFTQFDVSKEHFSGMAQEHVQRAGCPVRRELLGSSRTKAMRHFGLLPSRKTLLVFGGSQSAASIDGALAALFGQLKALGRRWQVLAIGGNESARLAELNDKETHLRFRWRPYCDRMDLAYAAADLALCRAGASSVAELTATGTPAVFMPYPWHRDQHQRSNAGPLAEARAAVICIDEIDPTTNAQTLGPALLAIMKDDERLQAMTEAARSLGSADAAEQVARWLARQQ
jgi:UDP-N-acetylglucosamine--N-acetylmuramyl-(pentapeptide) pyrophosphoryl-undecaprenol N-acetylglucosamine transferase